MTDQPTNQVQQQEHKFSPDPRPKRLNLKQKKTIEYWFDPNSETFGNLTQSAIKAGFRPKYALNLTSIKPLWLYENVESTLVLEQDHLRKGVQSIATKSHVDSKSPDDTRLKAYELLGKWSGLDNNKNTTNINIVTPILGGDSAKTTEVNNKDNTIIDIDTKSE